MTRRARWSTAVVVAALVATGAVVGVRHLLEHTVPPTPACTIGSGVRALVLVPDQAENATTIAAVGRRLGLGADAVTVALATALQESKLHNYPFGDRDSLGLFQQRPSQGWGRPAQLLTPAYAATAFYRHLAAVPRWQRLPLATAAQEVQHSADGSAYAQWEETARAMARALTGRVPAGMSCRFATAAAPQPAALTGLARRELGPGALDASAGDAEHDWTVATWLVGHARGYGIATVTARGRRWTPDTGRWVADPSVPPAPRYVLVRPG